MISKVFSFVGSFNNFTIYIYSCDLRQCWLVCAILLELSRGMASHILLFILGAL